MSQKRKYDPLYGGFSKKTDEGVFIFGPRIARAVILYALVAGDQFVGQGLPFSYRELKTLWHEAVVDAIGGAPYRCGLVPLLERIHDEKGRIGSTTEFDEVVRIMKNLNHQVYRDLCTISLIHLRKPVGREDGAVYEKLALSV